MTPPIPKAETDDQELCVKVSALVLQYLSWQRLKVMVREQVSRNSQVAHLWTQMEDDFETLVLSGLGRSRIMQETTMLNDPHAISTRELATEIPGAEIIRIYGVYEPQCHNLPSYEGEDASELVKYLSRICSTEHGSMIVAIPAEGEDEIPAFVLFRATPGSAEKLTEGTPISHPNLECSFFSEAMLESYANV